MDATIDQEIAARLAGTGLTLAAAESCTGGLLSARIVDRPGSSAYFMEGIVTYSNASKTARLGVLPETLERFGAVSAETAREMAAGAARTAGTDIGVSTTGVAGPDGGTKEKPVGLVYIGLSVRGQVSAERCLFGGDRRAIREQAAARALELLREALAPDTEPGGSVAG